MHSHVNLVLRSVGSKTSLQARLQTRLVRQDARALLMLLMLLMLLLMLLMLLMRPPAAAGGGGGPCFGSARPWWFGWGKERWEGRLGDW